VQQGTQSVVFVNDNGKANQRQVQIGMSDNTSIEIVSGVAAGEQVVVVGQNGLRDGASIQAVNPTPAGQRQGGGGQGGQRQGGGAPGGQGAQGGQGGGGG
jgi:hypothetical protein